MDNNMAADGEIGRTELSQASRDQEFTSATPGFEKSANLKAEGNVEYLTLRGAKGWAWLPAAPDEAVQVEAILPDGSVIGRAIANEMRQDIANSGRGTGRYGFTVTFSDELSSTSAPRLRIPGPDGPVVLPGVKWTAVEGYVDSLTRRGARGWAWMPSAPDQYAEIEAVLADGRVIGRAVANQMRPDIARSGRGNGLCGFNLVFDSALVDDEAPTLRVQGPDGPMKLPGVKLHPVEGFIDNLSRWGAFGWAWMSSAPNDAVRVEAVLKGRVIGTATADQMRKDVMNSGRGTGRYGFTLRFDEPLDSDNIAQLRVVAVDGRTVLPWDREGLRVDVDDTSGVPPVRAGQFPGQVATEAFGLSVEGHVDSVTRWGATGWAWMPSRPDAAASIEAVLDGQVVGSASADQMRPDLAAHGKGTGRYGFVLGFSEPIVGDTAPLLRVIGPEGPTVLPGGSDLLPPADPATVHIGNGAHRQDSLSAPALSVEGHVDNLTRGGAEGWAWMPSSPDAAVQVEAVLDNKVIGRTTADQPRPDLADWGKGTGLYGFKMSFDIPVEGNKAPILRVLAPLSQGLPGAARLPAATRRDVEIARRKRGSLATLLKEHAQFTAPGPEFEEFDPNILAKVPVEADTPSPLLLAFYLPQFHPIPENDRFWGKGFTEWRQLPKGKSRFPGHYQPRIPRDLGFYHLDGSLDALQAQAALAQAAGVNGFAFYYYWFNRQRVLEKPLDMLLQSDLKMPFMIIWANENWTRTWDGSESHILLKQDYNLEDEDALLGDLARHFVDPRYIRLGGRPLFVIYNPKNIPDPANTIRRWRQHLMARFGLNPLIFMAQTFGERDPHPYGLDGAIEFPPHKTADKLPGRSMPDAYSQDFAGRVIAYDDFVSASLSEDDAAFPLIKTIVPSWDNDCRRPNRGLSLEGTSPAKYEAWLQALILRAIDNPVFETPIVAINAWNEWAEAAYLEPDIYFGAGFLNATARAVVSALREHNTARLLLATQARDRLAVSVVLPNYNHERYLPERLRSVIDQTLAPSEIIFLDDCSSDDSVKIARAILNDADIPFQIVVNTENSGGVFRQWMKGVSLAKHELIWIAETDDFADRNFLLHAVAPFLREEVLASYGRITCVEPDGKPRADLDEYYDGLRDFSWHFSRSVPAYKAFSHDFAIKNVIPNASGLVFRKPRLSESEVRRLYEYRFAGDWYFYALIARGGEIAYSPKARSFFRVNQSSTSRSAFFTDRHLLEHSMIVRDLRLEYGIDDEAVEEHANALAVYFEGRSPAEIRETLAPASHASSLAPIRVCIAAHSFAVGGGEVMPLELANELRGRGFHVTYLVMDPMGGDKRAGIRHRLRPDISVVHWENVYDSFDKFLQDYGIQVLNSHNVSVEFQMYCRHVSVDIPFVASLHGGYETVEDLLTGDFVSYLNKTVTNWLYLADKNTRVLTKHGVSSAAFQHSFNAVPRFTGDWIERSAFRARYGIANDAFVFILCSRAIREKGWDTAVDVVTALTAQAKRRVHLVLIGDGPSLPELEEANAGLQCVTFLGHIDSPLRYFRCFDMGIFPSTFSGETFPLFLIECFQAGLPVITTDIGEIPRIMGNAAARPGAIVSHGGSREAIAAEMLEIALGLISDDELYLRMCANAYATSERFSIRQLGDLYEATLRSTLKDTGSEFAADAAGSVEAA